MFYRVTAYLDATDKPYDTETIDHNFELAEKVANELKAEMQHYYGGFFCVEIAAVLKTITE